MSAETDRLINNLRIRVPGATDSAITLELYNVLDDFLNETNVWQEEIVIQPVAGQLTYQLDSLDAASIHRLLGVYDSSGARVQAAMQEPSVVVLADKSFAPGTKLTVVVALNVMTPNNPAADIPYLPEWIWDRYMQDFIHGVQAQLFSQIAKPYSNERMAIYHMRVFAGAKSRARVEAKRKNTFATQMWRFPRTFAVT